jgi:hypothetical protein
MCEKNKGDRLLADAMLIHRACVNLLDLEGSKSRGLRLHESFGHSSSTDVSNFGSDFIIGN